MLQLICFFWHCLSKNTFSLKKAKMILYIVMPSTIGIISYLSKERNLRCGNYLNFSIIIQLTS